MKSPRLRRSLYLPLLALATALPAATWAADEGRLQQIEIDVRDLQRTVAAQARRIDELERRLREMSSTGATPTGKRGEPQQTSAPWLDPASWDRVREGMTAQQVIGILGVPASAREGETPQQRVLLYAVQVGASGFLSGSVTLENDRVVKISRPVLK